MSVSYVFAYVQSSSLEKRSASGHLLIKHRGLRQPSAEATGTRTRGASPGYDTTVMRLSDSTKETVPKQSGNELQKLVGEIGRALRCQPASTLHGVEVLGSHKPAHM